MNSRIKKPVATRGFTLVQLSIIITVAALVMVATLPSLQTKLNANKVSVERMNAVLLALRQYETVYGVLPCPADASIAMGNPNYGIASTNGEFGGGNCVQGSAPSANYYDSTNTVVIGMVPVRALGLSNDYALDGYGRYITYAVDARVTYGVSYLLPYRYTWDITSGNILVDDNGIVTNTVVALVSHGADGYGAWLPVNAASGTGVQLNSGSQDTDQWINAQSANNGGSFPSNYSSINSEATDEAGNNVMFVKKAPNSAFDDLVVYKNSQWNINQLPLVVKNMLTVSPPANGVDVAGELFPFSISSLYSMQTSGLAVPYLTANIGGTSDNLSFYVPATCHMQGMVHMCSMNGQTGTTVTTTTILSSAYYTTESGISGVSVTSPINNDITWYYSNAQAYNFNLPYGSGVLNGTGNTTLSSTAGVRVSAPPGIVVDTSGNCSSGNCIDVVDTLNARVTRWTTGGSYTSQFGSLGSTADTGTFTNPSGIAIDSSNNLWVVDTNNNRIEKWSPTGTYTTGATPYNYFGSYGSNVGSTSNPSQFNHPTGIAIGGPSICGTSQCLWVADTTNNRVSYCYMTGTSYGTCGTLVLTSNSTAIDYPTGMAFDSNSNLYVADTGNNRAIKFTWSTHYSGSVLMGAGTAGQGNGQFEAPTGIAVDGSGNIWVTDDQNNRVQVFNSSGVWLFTIGGGGVCKSSTYYSGSTCNLAAYPTPPTVDGTISTANLCYNTVVGCAAGNGSNGNYYFNNPTSITYSSSTGYIYVVDANNARVQVFNTSGGYVGQIPSAGGSGYGVYNPSVSTSCSTPSTAAPCFNF